MKKMLFVLASLLLASSLWAEKISVFVASSASKAMQEVKNEFIKKHPKDEVELIFGASGKHYQLLKEGREFDLFFSADAKYAAQIEKDGNAITKPAVYALGVVALYSLDEKFLQGGLEALASKAKDIKHLSIANPKVAPYGVAAEQSLKNLKIYDIFKDKIVLGDNISQPVIHVDTAAAEVGIVAYSLVSPINKPKGKAVLVDSKLFSPLEQSFVITKYAKGKKLATEFSNFVLSKEGKAIIEKYGFGTR
ncbi:molybdate ABC transporter substrate-binding protein [Campylobacter sp. MIT 12-8780]|uniref:molybdate ABC transporter substrate-binding protein n=1 Tax=unclassified Campylobacter TaxID=2593542 RepID=UPI00115DCA53|nr:MULTISPECIES: molybdate ABC transporter substrate-binding protein [unclassified Campylobacter]NDJ26819.1 molybdate ABC transporter substrate-binding protein [Campylobacter sp. MIT 19-121]TQR42360.1 molybdate ABC transporter substrate-binding protein [Campylobacter sp. MIT 12-8780]